MEILITWVGTHDPKGFNIRTRQTEIGPILSLLKSRTFDTVYLLLNLDSKADDFRQRATAVLRACQRYFPTVKVRQAPVDLVCVTDYLEIFHATHQVCQEILREEGREGRDYFVYLSPGTPQMQTVWVLLVLSGLLPARMIEATPRDLLAPGAPYWREVDLLVPNFPQVVNPGETARLVSLLQVQKENLAAENRALRAEIELPRVHAQSPADTTLSEGFRLRDYLLAQERALYARALAETRDNAARAARLLGIETAAFRARAATLGIRPRRRFPLGT